PPHRPLPRARAARPADGERDHRWGCGCGDGGNHSFGRNDAMNAPAKFQVDDDAAFRASVVGSSEVAALFDASPYLTRFELWHRKKGNIATPEFDAVADDGTPDNERIWWGVRLEKAILDAACERF